MQTILVPLDGSVMAEQALGTALVLAEALGVEVELVQVLDRTPDVDGDGVAAERYLVAVARQLGRRVPTRIRLIWGNPVDELLRTSGDGPGRMIVMSTRGRGGMERLILGSVTDRVVRNSTVPVVVVRHFPSGEAPRLKHLLVPLDGSQLAEGALALAIELARACGATLGLVRVAEVYPASSYGLSGDGIPTDDELLMELSEQLRDDARLYLDEVVRQARERGVRVVWEARVGRPADEIVRAAETTAADLVMMSTHGRGGFRRWAFGSVTDEVVRASPVPVLVLPPRYAGSAEVGAGLDGTPAQR
ncbi:MAG TPA: universal stress protein [Thermomicrobiaceae bacterium]|nr:universal stress protein [Thermomicrobiaceae bacterium]